MLQILESITDGIVIYDRQWEITFINHRGAEIIGRSPKDLLGNNLWDLYPEAINSTFYQELQRAVDERISVHFQSFYAPVNIWYEIHAYPSDEGVIVLYQEITAQKQTELALQKTCSELKNRVQERTSELTRISTLLEQQKASRQRAEEALRATNEQLARIFESITDGFCAVDRQWKFTYINQKAEQFLQKAQSELIGKNLWELYPKLDKTEFYRQCHQALGTSEPFQIEEFCLSLNLWFQATIYPSPNGISIYFQDITRRKQTEIECQQLLQREQEARSRAELAEQRCSFLAEASNVLASSLDCQTTLNSIAQLIVPFLADYCSIHILEADGQLKQIAAIHRDRQKQNLVDELARHIHAFLQNPHSIAAQIMRSSEPIILPEFSEAIAFQAARSANAQSVRQDPNVLEINRQLAPKSVMLIPLTARGQNLGAISLMMAESNRRYTEADCDLAVDLAGRAAMALDNAYLYEQAQAANRLKDEFLSTLSHELRTPLNAILGWAQILRRHQLDRRVVSKALETIERKAMEQVQIIYDLVDVSRLVTGLLQVEPIWVNLETVINRAIASVNLAAQAKSIQIETRFDPNVELLRGDPKYLQQIAWHLLSNAIKFTPQGGRVEVAIADRTDCIQLQVSDNGKGIEANFLPYAFDYFRQADSSSTRHYGGMGLGLALVRHLTELHGGTVHVESCGEGQGTTCTVQFPRSPGGRSPQEAHLESAFNLMSNNPPDLSGVKILAINDEANDCVALTLMLEEYGAGIEIATSIGEALNALTYSTPDILIGEVATLEENVYSLISSLRKVEAKARAIPAIALTTRAEEIQPRQVLAAGFHAHLAFPLEPIELATVVAQLVNSAQ